MSTVSIRKTHGEDYASIKTVVDQVIADLGGLEDIIKPGYKVIIKPNLVACPTERLSGGVTRWEVCLAIYEAVKAVGGEPVIAESSAAGADTELTIAKCGYQELRDKGIPVIDLKQKENARCTVDIENGVVFNKINTWELVRDCDAIITVPVMKTHDQTEVTLGMKNLKGLLIDTQKKDFHKKGLIEGVVDWCLHLKPCLEIIDGTYGQQGLGGYVGEHDGHVGGVAVAVAEGLEGEDTVRAEEEAAAREQVGAAGRARAQRDERGGAERGEQQAVEQARKPELLRDAAAEHGEDHDGDRAGHQRGGEGREEPGLGRGGDDADVGYIEDVPDAEGGHARGEEGVLVLVDHEEVADPAAEHRGQHGRRRAIYQRAVERGD